ncbi:aldo/keto reductase [Streptomyces sp. NPDC002564]|uniref:aldo/keto reductase n=1 Tax=Streptomyces sp. NPDC002564 TaxID=3364649 RepID=UPI00368C9E86
MTADHTHANIPTPSSSPDSAVSAVSAAPTGSGERLATTRLGDGGPEVGIQGLGCMGMSASYGPTDTDQARATLERALELGVTLYDTADVYGMGENEKFLAPFLKAHRDEVVLATKFALGVPTADPTKRRIDNSPDYIRTCVDASLRRLGTDVIDLYYMHRRDPAVPIEETVGVMAELVAAGKVKHLGLSEVTGPELRAAHAVHPIAAVQSEWSLFSRDVERAVVPTAAELGVALVPYSPLGRGFLTGSFVSAEKELTEDDFRRQQPRFTGTNASANAALLDSVRAVADTHGASLGQVALAWIQQQATAFDLPVVPIPGTRKPSRIEENTAATRITLTADDLALLAPIADAVSGDRYADMTFTSAGRE